MTDLIPIILEAGKQAPEWIRLLPLGEVKLSDGREPFTVDQGAVEAIIRQFTARGVDLVIDYEHQSLGSERAPAAGWVKNLESRPDGLYARVGWTAQAVEYLTNREYRYFSPVLRLDPETRRPTALMHVGLTNVPAINHLPPLVAKAEIEIQAQKAKKQEATPMLKKLIDKLGLSPETTEDQVVALVAERGQEAVALKAQIASLPEIALAAGLEDTATPAQIKGAVLALKQGAEHLQTLQAEVEALKTERREEKVQAEVAEALSAGKLTPAQREWAMTYARQDLEGFKVFVAQAPKLVPVGESFRFPREAGAGKGLPADAPADQILALKAQDLAREKRLDLVEATRQVWAENPDLVNRWQEDMGLSH